MSPPSTAREALIVEAIGYRNEDMAMPPKRKLSDGQIATITEWVEMGAPDPRDGRESTVGSRTKIDIGAGRKFWSFRPLAFVTQDVLS